MVHFPGAMELLNPRGGFFCRVCYFSAFLFMCFYISILDPLNLFAGSFSRVLSYMGGFQGIKISHCSCVCKLQSFIVSCVFHICIILIYRLNQRKSVAPKMAANEGWRANADTHKMTPEDVEKLGLQQSKKPPGKHPGTTLHQRGRLGISKSGTIVFSNC